MSDSIMASLGLASFDVTVQPHLCTSRSGKEVTVTEGELNTPLPRDCPECGGRMDRHDRHAVCVQGLPVLGRIHLLRVWVSRSRCRRCGHVESQKAGFVAQGHRITRRLERLIGLELACGHTLKQVAWKYNVHPSVVKDIDRRRLERRFKDRRPHRCRYLAVDEFLLHRGHRYATVFLDLESGDVLWCLRGHQQHDQDHTKICLRFQGHPVLLLQDLRELPQANSKLAIPQNSDLNPKKKLSSIKVKSMDVLTAEQRHRNMQAIKNKDSKIELILRHALWHKGYRYRKNYKKLPGKPDIAITKYHVAVFCDSEYFHGKDWDELKKELSVEKIRIFGLRRSVEISSMTAKLMQN